MKDSTGAYVETQNGPYNVTLSLISQGITSGTVISGVTNKNTTNGVANFQNLYAQSSGTFKLQASTASNLPIIETNAFSIINYVSSIVPNAPASVSQYFPFNITIMLLGDDSRPFIQGANVTIAEQSSLGLVGGVLTQIYPTTVTSITYANLYFTSSGTANLQVSTKSSQLIQGISIKVNASPLYVTFSPNV